MFTMPPMVMAPLDMSAMTMLVQQLHRGADFHVETVERVDRLGAFGDIAALASLTWPDIGFRTPPPSGGRATAGPVANTSGSTLRTTPLRFCRFDCFRHRAAIHARP